MMYTVPWQLQRVNAASMGEGTPRVSVMLCGSPCERLTGSTNQKYPPETDGGHHKEHSQTASFSIVVLEAGLGLDSDELTRVL